METHQTETLATPIIYRHLCKNLYFPEYDWRWRKRNIKLTKKKRWVLHPVSVVWLLPEELMHFCVVMFGFNCVYRVIYLRLRRSVSPEWRWPECWWRGTSTKSDWWSCRKLCGGLRWSGDEAMSGGRMEQSASDVLLELKLLSVITLCCTKKKSTYPDT